MTTNKSGEWVLVMGLRLLLASLFLLTPPASSLLEATERQVGKTMAYEGSEGSWNCTGNWEFGQGYGGDSDWNWTYTYGKGSGPDNISFGSATGEGADGSRFGYGWGSSSSAPSYDGTFPQNGDTNECSCDSTNHLPPAPVSAHIMDMD